MNLKNGPNYSLTAPKTGVCARLCISYGRYNPA